VQVVVGTSGTQVGIKQVLSAESQSWMHASSIVHGPRLEHSDDSAGVIMVTHLQPAPGTHSQYVYSTANAEAGTERTMTRPSMQARVATTADDHTRCAVIR